MIQTRLASETRRMCAKHPDKPAVQLRKRIRKASAGEYIETRPECQDCATRAKDGTTRRL